VNQDVQSSSTGSITGPPPKIYGRWDILRMTWVETQTDDLVEATFTFDKDSPALKGFVIRAGVESEGSATPACARRPESDTQWSVVIRAPSC